MQKIKYIVIGIIVGLSLFFFVRFEIDMYNAVIFSQDQDNLTASFIQDTMPDQYKAWQEKHQLQTNEAKK